MAQTYQQLCPVLIGDDAVQAMAAKAVQEGRKKVFLVCDKGITKTGMADMVIKELKAAGVEDVKHFDDIEPEAPDTFIDKIAAEMKAYGPDLIIGLGGGSSIDAAKGGGVVCDNGGLAKEYFIERDNKPFVVKTPVYVIPTASGTGSEVTPMCVIHDTEQEQKNTIWRPAELAVLDPHMTVSCPRSVTANSGLDALSHAIEAYTSVAQNPKDRLLCREAIRLIRDNLDICMNEPDNLKARGNMQFAANIAGIAFADQSVHVGHLFAHELGLVYGLNHGYACAISIPETLEFVAESKPEDIKDIAEAMRVEIPEGYNNKETAHLIADGIRKWMKDLGVKTLKESGLTREQVLEIADDAIGHGWFHVMAPGDVSVEQMREFCAGAYDHYQ